MPTSPGDRLASRGKTRPDRFPRDRARQGVQRPWFCRTCGQVVDSLYLPAGWYALTRQQGEMRSDDPTRPRHTRLGAYCSIRCLEWMLPRIEGIGAELDQRQVDAYLRGVS